MKPSLARMIIGRATPIRSQAPGSPQHDLESLGASLPKLTDLSIASDNSIEQITHPEQYLRQYLPVLQQGKKRIFIFAFCDVPKQGIPSYWRTTLFLLRDSDRAVWSAYFDLDSRNFLNLRFHGRCPHYFR